MWLQQLSALHRMQEYRLSDIYYIWWQICILFHTQRSQQCHADTQMVLTLYCHFPQLLCIILNDNIILYQHLWYQLKATIKDFNLDAYYFISVKYEMYRQSLYFIPPFKQFTTFFSEYQHDFSLMFYTVFQPLQKWSWPLKKWSHPLRKVSKPLQ